MITYEEAVELLKKPDSAITYEEWIAITEEWAYRWKKYFDTVGKGEK